jgi:hypothetical protein
MCRSFLCVNAFLCKRICVSFFCAQKLSVRNRFSLTVKAFCRAEEQRWVEKSLDEMRKVEQCSDEMKIAEKNVDDKWEGMRNDETGWEQLRWGEKGPDEMRWDEMKCGVWSVSVKCKCKVWSLKCEECSVKCGAPSWTFGIVHHCRTKADASSIDA